MYLIGDPRIKYFWTHGGLLGSTESVFCGKPSIITPIYGDQFLNAYALKNRKLGVIVPFEEITEEKLIKFIQELQRPR